MRRGGGGDRHAATDRHAIAITRISGLKPRTREQARAAAAGGATLGGEAEVDASVGFFLNRSTMNGPDQLRN